jgi:6-pyruvoyltetrahydropterin/6-carboxytetrahydropterin synthase
VIIRKKFSFNGSHVVRNCSSERCKKSIHSHTYIVELFFTSNGLDNGMMVMDFGLMKGTIKDFVSAFNDTYSIWNKEDEEFKKFIKENYDRWIEMPVSPSAEAYSLMFFKVIDKILKATEFNNGEQEVHLHSVRVHETATGYAEAFKEDMDWVDFDVKDIVLSENVTNKFNDPKMFEKLIEFVENKSEKIFINEAVEQQV